MQGPNLDLAFKQSVADGLGRSTIEGVVRKQIDLPQGEQMPANLVEGKDADAVAAYVASAIGKKGAGGGGGPSGTAKADAQNTVQIPADANGQLAYQFKSAEAKAGKVTLESQNDSSVPHNIALKGGPRGPDRPGRQDLDDHREPEARQGDLLLQRSRPRAGRDEGHPDGQVAGAGAVRRLAVQVDHHVGDREVEALLGAIRRRRAPASWTGRRGASR